MQQITFPKSARPSSSPTKLPARFILWEGIRKLASLAPFGWTARLGDCRRIDYKQRKEHVPEPEIDEWRHEFGEESGIKPVLLYDAQKKRLLLEGGEYRIQAEGIVN